MTSTTIYIGDDLWDLLQEEEQKTFEFVDRCSPKGVFEREWDDPRETFKSILEYEDFWGGDQSEVGGDVFKKEFDSSTPLTDEEKNRFIELSKQLEPDAEGRHQLIIRE